MPAALFWTILVAMAALAVSVVLRPLWAVGPNAPAAADPGQIYRTQLEEISTDLERGTITPDEAQRLRAEVARRLLDLDRQSAVLARPLPRNQLIAAAAMIIGLGFGALGLYARMGQPQMPDMGLALRFAASEAAYAGRPDQAQAQADAKAALGQVQAAADPEILALLDQLRGVLKERPTDLQGLTFLVEYEARVGNFAAAVQAQEKLIAVKGASAGAEDHAVMAQNMIMAAGQLVTPQAEAVLSQALSMDPSNPRATYFLGLMFTQIGRPDKTLPLWQGLLMTEPDSAPWTQPIRASIMDIAAAAGQRFSMPDLHGPTAGEVEAAAGMAAEERPAMILEMVAGLEERLFATGGSLQEWQQLLQALSVLGDGPRASKARAAGEFAFVTNPSAQAQLSAFADQMGIAP